SAPCLACNRIRGYIYTGPAYSERFHYLRGSLCPWCIADGSAARRFQATFNDTELLEGVSREVVEEIEQRTPGFDAWQQEEWLGCCSDAAEFLGVTGAAELRDRFPEAIPAVKAYIRDNYDLHGNELDGFFDGLSKSGEPSAYLFRCLHCRRYLA